MCNIVYHITKATPSLVTCYVCCFWFVVCLFLFAPLGIAFTISSLPSYHDPIKRCNSMGFSVACRLAILAMALTGQVDELLETTNTAL